MTRHTSLWRHSDFLALWSSQTLAALSAQITQLALPLIAVLTLSASPFEMGLLVTMTTLPNLLVGLFVGSWVDRMRRRPLMIASDVTRAILLVSIPVASLFNLLTLEQLYIVLFLFGIGTTVFDVTNVSYLPMLVGRSLVLQANSRIVASTSFAGAVGPGLAGLLVQLITAPIAILIDATSLALSAALLNTIQFKETAPHLVTTVPASGRISLTVWGLSMVNRCYDSSPDQACCIYFLITSWLRCTYCMQSVSWQLHPLHLALFMRSVEWVQFWDPSLQCQLHIVWGSDIH